VSYTTRCHRSLFANRPAICASVSEWLKLVTAIFVAAPVPVDDERIFLPWVSSLRTIRATDYRRGISQHVLVHSPPKTP
jgi:hypothetical protein